MSKLGLSWTICACIQSSGHAGHGKIYWRWRLSCRIEGTAYTLFWTRHRTDPSWSHHTVATTISWYTKSPSNSQFPFSTNMVLSVHNFLFFSDFNAQQNTSLTMRIIGSVLRRNGEQSVYNSMVEVVQLQRQFPDFVVGFDLVDEEDRFSNSFELKEKY